MGEVDGDGGGETIDVGRSSQAGWRLVINQAKPKVPFDTENDEWMLPSHSLGQVLVYFFDLAGSRPDMALEMDDLEGCEGWRVGGC